MTILSPPQKILQRYFPATADVQVCVLGEGNINDTFLVKGPQKAIVLQRINDQVFPVPQLLIDNLQQLTRHLLASPGRSRQRWEDAVLVPTLDGSLSVLDGSTKLWRALSYISNSTSISRVTTTLQAEQTGWALGHFHKRLTGLDESRIQVVLPGFHDISSYLSHYDHLLLPTTLNHDPADVRFCVDMIKRERISVLSLERAVRKGNLHPTIIHGDPKVANVLFDQKSGRAVSIIDLDTVGPGLRQHDIGDCLRSVCNTAGEECDPTEVHFNLDVCRSTLKGYFQEAGPLLTTNDREYIYDGLKTITFELGLRFFTDYLQGGSYFKCSSPEETLQKALVQFSLLRDTIDQEHTIRSLLFEG
jgi:Ser/Thr protein kinase RdoA (MazF antagonist)